MPLEEVCYAVVDRSVFPPFILEINVMANIATRLNIQAEAREFLKLALPLQVPKLLKQRRGLSIPS
jgi:hypothetical protein